jgi:hypothetical protein
LELHNLNPCDINISANKSWRDWLWASEVLAEILPFSELPLQGPHEYLEASCRKDLPANVGTPQN